MAKSPALLPSGQSVLMATFSTASARPALVGLAMVRIGTPLQHDACSSDGVAKAVPLSLIRAKGLSSTFQVGDGSAATIVPMHLNFFGHYEEKGVKICSPDLSLPRGDCEEVHHIEYDLEQEEWHCVSSELVSESHINQSNTSSNPAGNEYGTQHRDYVVQGVLEHNEQVTEKEAQAWFDTHCEKNRAKLDFGPNFE